MAGEIPVRALMGSLGAESWDGQQVMLGTRIPFSTNPSLSVPLSTTGVLTATFTVPKMGATDALWIEHAAATVFPNDASGKLVLQAVVSTVSDTTAGTNLPMETIASLGTMPANAASAIGVFLQPPPPVRCRDFLNGKPGDTIVINVTASVQNTDAAVAHVFAIVFSGIVRILSGVSA